MMPSQVKSELLAMSRRMHSTALEMDQGNQAALQLYAFASSLEILAESSPPLEGRSFSWLAASSFVLSVLALGVSVGHALPWLVELISANLGW